MHYSFYISSDFCLTAIKWSNVHLYHGENKLHSMRWWCLFCTVCTVEQWLNMLSWSLCVSSEQYVLLCLPCLVRFILITVNYHWHLYRKQLDFLIEAQKWMGFEARIVFWYCRLPAISENNSGFESQKGLVIIIWMKYYLLINFKALDVMTPWV